ncbi:MAG: hypothetical protein CBC42_07560 [Betaproteobacteria bacterium TMED82]|nr:MAG: hypothetical protein CBC42_07560 [Betaproteobacteria bacterium TMED82]|tara:strand:- start:5341 stop:7167 length:1827 start_codon:yes stop_codon:yes gene_type:complete
MRKIIRLRVCFLVLLILFLISESLQASKFVSAIALGSKPKYGEGFERFEYTGLKPLVGGELKLAAMGSFDKINPFTLKGIPSRGLMTLIFEPLAIASLDEPMTMYGLIAKEMFFADDELSMTFKLNPKARFSNGDFITANDVKFSFETLVSKSASPIWKNLWSDVERAEIISERIIRFKFKRKNRELHMVIASLPIFSRKWIGKDEDFSQISMKNPIASGPYSIKRVDLGKNIFFEKRDDYWAKDHPARKNQFNFKTVSFRYYKDAFARLEAFKAGEFDFIHENTAKNWARSYEGKQFRKGNLSKKELPNSNPAGMQGYIFNVRNPLFKDRRVRKAISLAMDFEWMNRQLFYNQYIRSYSYFTNTKLAALGIASDAESDLLNKISKRIKIPFDPEILGPVPLPARNISSTSLRENLRSAKRLLETAGWVIKDGKLKNNRGESFNFEILLSSRGWERVVAPFTRNLKKLGIQLNTRVTDISLYKKRIDNFEFDMLVHWYLSSQNPGNELYNRFGSNSAIQKGSDNFIGLSDPFIDETIRVILSSKKRSDLVIASKLLDRQLLSGFYVIPHWHNTVHRIAFDSNLRGPKTSPLYYHSEDWAMATWWWGTE